MLCFLLRFACCLRTHKSVSFPCMPCKHIEGVPGFVGQSQHLVFYSFEYMPSCWYRQKASWRVGFHTSAKNELSDQNHSKSNLLSISFQRTYDLRVARLRVSDILHMVLVFQMMGWCSLCQRCQRAFRAEVCIEQEFSMSIILSESAEALRRRLFFFKIPWFDAEGVTA